MRTAVFILCLAFTSTAHSSKCQNFIRRVLKLENTAHHLVEAILSTDHMVGRLVLMPQYELSIRPGIEVVGSLISSRKTGEQLAQHLADFDLTMNNLGLETPTLTKIVVSDRTILPNFIGPGHLHKNYFNLWRISKAEDTIIIQPLIYLHQNHTNPLALFHERVHSILKKKYSFNSFINVNRPLQEGLADFLTVYHKDNPKLNYFIILFRRDASRTPKTLPRSILRDSHKSGSVFSHILWKLREHIGKEEMASLFKPFIDNLNQYYESFRKQQNHSIFSEILRPQYEYFMAVLKKTLHEKGKVQEANGFIDEMATLLKLDMNAIDDIAGSITKSEKNFYASAEDEDNLPSVDMATTATMYVLGAATITLEGYFLYHILFGQRD